MSLIDLHPAPASHGGSVRALMRSLFFLNDLVKDATNHRFGRWNRILKPFSIAIGALDFTQRALGRRQFLGACGAEFLRHRLGQGFRTFSHLQIGRSVVTGQRLAGTAPF